MTRTRFTLSLALAALSLAAVACTSNVPEVSGRDPVIPERNAGPSRAAQALSSPSTADSAESSNESAYCIGGAQTTNEYDAESGAFVSEWTCDPGGGIASVRSEGLIDPNTGDGSYDQTQALESGGVIVWHFTQDTSDDFLVATYAGSDGNGQSYVGVYTYVDQNSTAVHEEWNLDEGSYVIDGAYDAAGGFVGSTTFDDPATEQSPDWVSDETRDAEGNGEQTVHFVGDGYVSDYTVVYLATGEQSYEFATDIVDTIAEPDYVGGYDYAADFSGSGHYRQNYDDGSTLDVEDVIHADGAVDESWVFDDASTEQPIDQEGSMSYDALGNGSGTITTHVVDGGSQTCDIQVGADGSQTIDNCQ